jgi:SSS family solute:Na+ symporter
MAFTTLDWSFILAYLLFAFGIGVAMSSAASKSLNSYFVANRSLPWWWLGTSMVATTFAADTPLAITGIVAKDGIAGNWFWWSWAFLHIAITVFFAARWRRAEVLTDAELIELRYAGKPAALLRGFKAFFLSVVVNCIILGWVFRAMSKIADPFLKWELILPAGAWATFQAVWPGWLIFDNPNNTLTVLLILSLTVAYSSMGGIRGVILTDLFQFGMAMVGSIIFAWYAVDKVGGLNGMLVLLHGQYDNAGEILSFMPSLSAVSMPFTVFLIYVGLQWWVRYDSDGSGYLAQRLMTAKTPEDATKGSLWFAAAFFGLRTWPWILVGLAALVLFPKGAETSIYAEGALVAADREMGYPLLMKLLLPPGVLGLLFTSLLAAFMSTVDTHLNWGTSYLVNDLYKRFYAPKASQKTLVRASRFGLILLAIAAVLIASQIGSIEKAWKFLAALGAGLGLPSILRWVWWRANAWTEIVGMLSAAIAALILYPLFPEVRDEYLLLVIAAISIACCLAATFLTKPVPAATLKAFQEKVRPVGFWKGAPQRRKALWEMFGAWAAGSAGVLLLMLGLGKMLLGPALLGLGMLLAGLALLRLCYNAALRLA